MDTDILYNMMIFLTGGIIAVAMKNLLDRQAPASLKGPKLGGSYEPQQVLCDQRYAMLRTVELAFPDLTVLPRVPAILLVSPRGGERLTQRREALRRRVLDYVVLDPHGKPLFAFNIDSSVKRTRRGIHRGADAFTTWALQQAGISVYPLSGMRSKVSPQRLRAAVGWEGKVNPPQNQTVPLRAPL